MPIEILMPALSPTMTEGNLAKWLVKEGDKIKSGQVIAEIETDKATMEVEAVDEGVLGRILVPAGTEGVKVNAPVALLLAEGEDKAALADYKPKDSASGIQDSGKKEAPPQAPTPPTAPSPESRMPNPESARSGRVPASPLAKRIAAAEGVSLAEISGSGPHGRVVKADVESFLASGGAGRGAVRRNPQEFTKIPNNNMRKVIARRLTESKSQVPHFYLTVECELDRLLDLRKQLNEAAEKNAGAAVRGVPGEQPKARSGDSPKAGGKPAYKLSVNDLVIKAAALALRDIPAANASWSDEAVLQYTNVDISVAVAIEGGLITPIVKNADQKSVMQISSEMKDLAARARENKLKPEEFQGGGFSISNLGMYGVKTFSAIINPPQGAILAVGAGEERAVVRGGQVTIRQMMDCTLSVDHRVVDGALGAQLLQALKGYVESPALLLV
ncbi:MAG: pyruvate dehydrogenase complex dihydrolipoamide acetyltransferase [Alphaproteobacteria bacterium]|nr:pyruvate dehydrogenase complex dihydrolipoamide acetyltransferase [Alphaproteobacteria bacterium]